jgi:hypothetical protein
VRYVCIEMSSNRIGNSRGPDKAQHGQKHVQDKQDADTEVFYNHEQSAS